MSLEMWMAYVIAAWIVLIIPGPTIILVISKAMINGRHAVLPLTAGVTLGDLTSMTLSLMGLGAILAASATVFIILKWIGATYLMYLGVKLLLSSREIHDISATNQRDSSVSLFKSAYIVTALNPKGIAFFVAFMPQFVNPKYDPMPQLLTLGATFLVSAAINAMLYALFAGNMSEYVRNVKVQRWMNGCGAGALIGAGILTAVTKRS